jgi:hypothetical protein
MIRVYLYLRSALSRFYYFIDAVFTGMMLGLFSRRHLHELDSLFYRKSFFEYSSDKYIESGLHIWEKLALECWFSKCNKLCITSAGAGREVLSLYRMGYEVEAFEPDQNLRERGNQALSKLGVKISGSERDLFPDLASPMDGCIVGWGSYMLIAGRNKRISFLKSMAKRMQIASPVLISFFQRENSLRYKIIFYLANLIRSFLLREFVEEGDDLGWEFFHRFTEDELKEEFEESGFEIVEFKSFPYPHAVGVLRERF